MMKNAATVAESWHAHFAEAKAAQEAGRWEAALESYEALLHILPASEAEAGIEILRRIAAVHYSRGDLELAEEVLEASCAAARAHGSQRHLASGLNFVATVQQAAGRLDAAESTYLEAFGVAESAGHDRLAVMIEQNLGTIARVRGDSAGALRRYERALQRHRAWGEDEGIAWVLNHIGMVHTDVREWAAAEAAFEGAAQMASAREDDQMLGTIQLNRADCRLQRGRTEHARVCLDHALELFGRLGCRAGVGEATKLYGVWYRTTGKPQLADAYLGVVADHAGTAGYLQLEAESRAEHALVHLDLDRHADALRSLNRAHRLFTELQARRELPDLEKRLDALERSYLQIVQAWGESIESKDRYTAGHCSRVADVTVCLASAIGYSGRELTWIRMGAFLHDVGKAEVDAAVLNKPGKLDDAEWQQVKRHTVAGDEIVAELGFPWDIRPIVRSHHERWDGRGYPDGLAGNAIPLTARVLCIADVFDALTTTRSYRAAHTREEAMAIMAEEAGRLFDPALFAVFQRLYASGTLAAALDAGRAAA
jgi:putative nucleotidyltransferase with HDIG domain